MDAALFWTIVGSGAGVIGVAVGALALVAQLRAGRKKDLLHAPRVVQVVVGDRHPRQGDDSMASALSAVRDYLNDPSPSGESIAGSQAQPKILAAAEERVADSQAESSSAERPGLQPIPQIWNVPNRNADFTGRAAVLEKLRGELSNGGLAAVTAQALYGLGGVGKTQVALEYSHRFKSDYDLIWWIPAERPQAIILSLAELASRMGLQADNAAETAAFTLEQLRRGTGGRWLLVYDNAEEPADLAPYLPSGQGHVIITSRNHAWTRYARPVELDVFTRRESVAHLLQHVPGLSSDSAAKISAAAGDLPLAVEQAAAWLAETGMSASEYVERLEAQPVDALGPAGPFEYAMPVAATWNLSLGRLRERSPAAVRLLQILAWCSPEPVSAVLLYGSAMRAALLPVDPALGDALAVGGVVREASRLSLVKVHGGNSSVQMHRLVQAVIRSTMTPDQQSECRHAVHRILAAARPDQGEADNPASWPAYDVIWPHLEPSQAEACDDERTRELLLDWMRYQRIRGELEPAAALAGCLQRRWESELGPDDQQTLNLQFQLGNVMRVQGRHSEARDLDTRVLDRQRAVLGPSHTDTLATAYALAADLRALGDFRGALALDQKTYASFSEHFGEDYERTLRAANNLACSLRQVGDFTAARLLDEQTLNRRRRVLGPDDPRTLHSASNLGRDLREIGALRQSVELLRVTRDAYASVVGNETLGALLTAKSLAVSLRRTGELNEAKQLTQETYGHYLKRYGPENPDSLSCALNLASDYSSNGDNDRALHIAEEVNSRYQQTLGRRHPFTLCAKNNMLLFLRATGKLAQALELARENLSEMRDGIGSEHPFTLSCAVNLAVCLCDSSSRAQAEALQIQTLSVLKKVRGPEHPDTLTCEAGIAITLNRAGDTVEAERIRKQALAKLIRIVGVEHPLTISVQNWRHSTCDIEASPI